LERDEEICGEWEYTARDEPDEGEVGGRSRCDGERARSHNQVAVKDSRQWRICTYGLAPR
jgi:hypothetical protein